MQQHSQAVGPWAVTDHRPLAVCAEHPKPLRSKRAQCVQLQVRPSKQRKMALAHLLEALARPHIVLCHYTTHTNCRQVQLLAHKHMKHKQNEGTQRHQRAWTHFTRCCAHTIHRSTAGLHAQEQAHRRVPELKHLSALTQLLWCVTPGQPAQADRLSSGSTHSTHV